MKIFIIRMGLIKKYNLNYIFDMINETNIAVN